MDVPTFISLASANPKGTVLANLRSGAAPVQSAISAVLNASLQAKLRAALTATPVLSSLSAQVTLTSAALVAAKDAALPVFLKQQLDPIVAKDPTMQQAVNGEIARLTDNTTVSDLLGLDQPLQSNPAFASDMAKAGIASLLATSPTLASQQQLQADFINQYAAWTGSIGAFWATLSANPEFTKAVPELQLTLQLGTLTSNNAPLVSAIRSTYQISSLRDLTTIDAKQWSALIATKGIEVPAGIAQSTGLSASDNYAAAILSLLEAAFPTDYVTLAFESSTDPLNRYVAKFLADSRSFDFRSSNIDAYITQNKDALNGIPTEQKAAVITRLKAVQRVFRVDTDPVIIQSLIGANLDSARKIAAIPQGLFLRRYQSLLGGVQPATVIYNSARQLATFTATLYRGIQEGLQGLNPYTIGNAGGALTSPLAQVIPNWQSLFGSTGYCECDECDAMDGPAAYFVDVLQFLQNGLAEGSAQPSSVSSANAAGYSPLDVLIGYQNNPNNYDWSVTPPTLDTAPDSTPPLGRRPDLAYLDLTCANADTSLPYVDLVNEILESYVYYVGMNGASALPPQSNNTPSDATTPELDSNPEFTIQAVYAAGAPLASAVYPFKLPFDRYLETARVYLASLNTSLYDVMRTFNTAGSAYDLQIDCESLGLSPQERQIIDGSAPDALAQYYGYPASVTEATLITPTTPITTTPVTNAYLGSVANFLACTALSPTDLVCLLETRYLNPSQSVSITTPTSVTDSSGNTVSVSPCDPTYATFTNLYGSRTVFTRLPDGRAGPAIVYPGFLVKAYRFIRLWRKTGWAMQDLDKTLTALGITSDLAITDSTLMAIDQIKTLSATLSLSVTQILSLFSTMDADGRGSLYNSLFQNKTVLNPVDPNFQLTYQASLSVLPSALPMTWPGNMPITWSNGSVSSPRLTYDATEQFLEFVGTMTDDQEAFLLTWAATSPGAALAVQNLFNERWTPGTDVAIPLGLGAAPVCAHLNTILAALQVSDDDLTAIAVDCDLIPPGANLNSMATLVLVTPLPPGTTTLTLVTTLTIVKVVSVIDAQYTLTATDTASTAASGLVAAINANARLSAYGIYAAAQGTVISLYAPPAAPHLSYVWNASYTVATVETALPLAACPTLTLANLSAFFRYALLAQALNLSVTDLISLKTLSGVNPFAAPSSAGTSRLPLSRFVKAAKEVQSSKFSVAQLDYLYRALPDVADSLPPSLPLQQQLLCSLSTGLQKIAAANAFSSDPTGKTLRSKLSTLLPATGVDPAMNLIAGSTTYTSPLSAFPGDINRAMAAPALLTRVVVGGSPTLGDSVSLTINSSGVTTQVPTVTCPVTAVILASPDPLTAIATALASQVNTSFGALGINATPSGHVLTLSTPLALAPLQAWTATTSPATAGQAATETLTAMDAQLQAVSYQSSLTLGGTVTPGETVTLSAALNGVSGSPVSLTYVVTQTDSFNSIAIGLAAQINGSSPLNALGITASTSGSIVSVSTPLLVNPDPSCTASARVSTEQVAVAPAATSCTVTIAGSASAGDTVTLLFSTSSATAGFPLPVAYTVTSTDTTSTITSALVGIIIAQPALSPTYVSACSAAANVLTITWAATALTVTTPTTPVAKPAAAATETVTVGGTAPRNSITITGVPTPGDTLTLTLQAGASAPSVTASYVVVASDTLGTVANSLCANVTTALNGAHISATASAQANAITLVSTAGPSAQLIVTAVVSSSQTPTEQISIGGNPVILWGGSLTAGDVLGVTVLVGGQSSARTFTHSVSATDSLASVATLFAQSLSADTTLSAAGLSASAAGAYVTLGDGPSLAPTLNWSSTVAPARGAAAATLQCAAAGTALACSGPMSAVTRANLTALASTSDTLFLDAVRDLYEQAQDILTGLFFLAPDTIFQAPLATLPGTMNLPPAPPGYVTFISTITVAGALTAGDQLTLVMTPASGAAVSLPPYAVTALDTTASVAAKLAALVNANPPAAGITASSLGPSVVFSLPVSTPAPTWGLAPFTGTEKLTFFNGLQATSPLDNPTRQQLVALSPTDRSYRQALERLYVQAWQQAEQLLIDTPAPPVAATRYDAVLEELLGYLDATQSQDLVKQSVAQFLDLPTDMVALLLTGDPTTATPALLPAESLASQSPPPAIDDFLGGVLGVYFSDGMAATPVRSQVDPGIDLDGTEASFGSAQWFGQLVPPTSDTYTFTVSAGGVALASPIQLWVADQLVLDTLDSPVVNTSVNLAAGQIYDFQLNALEATGAPALELQWSNSTLAQQTIPATAFVLGADPASAAGVSGQTSTWLQGGAYSTLSRLNRIAVLVNGLSMQTSEAAYLSAHGMDFAGVNRNDGDTVPFDLSALPLDYFAPAAATGSTNPLQPSLDSRAPAFFAQWQRLARLYALKASLPSGGDVGLFDIFAAAAESTGQTLTLTALIALATGWDSKELGILTGKQSDSVYKSQIGFGYDDGDFRNEKALRRLATCLALVATVGVSSQQLFIWANNTPDVTQAQNIQTTVKAKYSPAVWLTIGKPLSDTIRTRSRDALIAYILTMAPIVALQLTDADDLYDYFLIDVEMCTCMETSRLVQGTATVQQFVQRCLLNLESASSNTDLDVAPSSIDGTSWNTWRMNYRIWQAAVQIFLYPENWIDPTIRDDRTEPFIAMQNQLMQASVTAANAEQAFLGYLQSLQQIENLQMMGLYTQQDSTTGANVTHVFARTPNTPYTYFYRTLDNASRIWAAWTQLDVGITGDQLIPLVYANRPFVFWPNYQETTDPNSNDFSASYSSNASGQGSSSGSGSGSSSSTTITPSGTSLKSLAVTFSWSELQNGQWTSEQTTPPASAFVPYIWTIAPNAASVVASQLYTTTLDTPEFSFSAAGGDSLQINMYQSLYLTSTNYPGYQGYWCSLLGSVTDSGSGTFTTYINQTTGGDPSSPAIGNPFPTWDPTWGPANMGVMSVGSPPPLGPPTQPLPATELTLMSYDQATETSTPVPVLMPPTGFQAGYSLMFPQALMGYYALTVSGPNFFYQDGQRTFYVTEEPGLVIAQLTDPAQAAPASSSSMLAGNAAAASPAVPPESALDSLPTLPQFALDQYLPADQWRWYWQSSYFPVALVLFQNHYHPWVDEFINIYNWQDVPGVLSLPTQQLGGSADPDPSDGYNYFAGASGYGPQPSVAQPYPQPIVDLCATGAYSLYNWELFFHVPFLIATLLSQNQQFQDAQTWFHYIFNPTTDSSQPTPNRYWNFLFFNQSTPDGSLADLLNALMQPGSAGYAEAYAQVTQWWQTPADPDAIARLRPVAYQKAVVMAYLDNLIAWGDSLFSQNTRESINEATQLYVLANKILGPQPASMPAQGFVAPVCYRDLQWDAVDNAYVQLENLFPFTVSSNPSSSADSGSSVSLSQGGFTSTGTAVPYFCTPVNSQLLAYWSTVADRLYKIRHCMNIQGQVQQLPLFAPPINPALLVQAAAAGVDLTSVLSAMNSPLPNYRFRATLAKALELCSETRSLGGSLLSALEKKDAEALALLRAGQEIAVLQAVLLVKQTQLNEAQMNVQALQDSLAVTQARQTYYQTLVSGGLSSLETSQLTSLTQSQNLKQASQLAGLVGSGLSLIPQLEFGGSGFGGTPVASASFGGQQLATMASMVAQAYSAAAEYFAFCANLAGLTAGWSRRGAEWAFQLQSATLEITQLNDQISAAQLREQSAQQDLANQQLQINNAQAVQTFLTSKFTSVDLYSWMIDQISTVYFQAYQLAFDLAQRTEVCFRYELGLPTSNYIQFGYWDSLKQGLLAGEKLFLDLKRLEGAYLDQNQREYEISRSISLVLLDPVALITLKETGQCVFTLPEAFFDMDYPGQYLRRIKTLSLTIPCVTGPYTSVNCTLTLLQSKTRWDNSIGSSAASYAETPVGGDQRFLYNFSATQSIATSTAQSDSGLFEVNFNDERYLPFEGAGAVSQWLISMPQDCNAFDFETITDVIVNLKYTARAGGAALQAAAQQAAVMPPPTQQSQSSPASSPAPKQANQVRYFSLKHEFPNEWYQFFHPSSTATSQTMALPLRADRFPFQYRGRKLSVSQVQLYLKLKAVYPGNPNSTPLADYASAPPLVVSLSPPTPPGQAATTQSAPLASSAGFLDGIPNAAVTFTTPIVLSASGQAPWILNLTAGSLPSGLQGAANVAGSSGYFLNYAVVDDMYMVAQYCAA